MQHLNVQKSHRALENGDIAATVHIASSMNRGLNRNVFAACAGYFFYRRVNRLWMSEVASTTNHGAVITPPHLKEQ